MALDTCLSIQNQLSDWVYLFIWWNDSKPANWYFWKYFFRFWSSSVIRGTPPNIFFRIFFDGKIFFVHSSFFSENGVRNELQTKESQRFFRGGVIMTPPLDLQGLIHVLCIIRTVCFVKHSAVWFFKQCNDYNPFMLLVEINKHSTVCRGSIS